MNRQANANQSRPAYDTEHDVKCDEPRFMQWMKSNTASTGIVERTGKQVIDIDEHGRHHREPGCLPVPPEEKPGQDGRYDEMQYQMKHGLHYRLG